jgi:hypothetical protein
LISGFQTPLIKLDKGDFYVSICLWRYLQKLNFLIYNSFQHYQRHDPRGALVQHLFLWCLDNFYCMAGWLV